MSLKFGLIRVVGLAVLFATVGVSKASSVTTANFDLGGNGGLEPSYSFNVNGIGLTVTALTVSDAGVFAPPVQVGQYSDGLGVTNSVNGDAYLADGLGYNDVLVFTFNRDVRIDSIDFAYNDGEYTGDYFRFYYDKDGALASLGDFDIPGSDFYSSYLLNDGHIGRLFGIGALGYNHEFLVKGISVTTVVPLPSALLLTLSAMGLLGGLGWRSRRSGEVAA